MRLSRIIVKWSASESHHNKKRLKMTNTVDLSEATGGPASARNAVHEMGFLLGIALVAIGIGTDDFLGTPFGEVVVCSFLSVASGRPAYLNRTLSDADLSALSITTHHE